MISYHDFFILIYSEAFGEIPVNTPPGGGVFKRKKRKKQKILQKGIDKREEWGYIKRAVRATVRKARKNFSKK